MPIQQKFDHKLAKTLYTKGIPVPEIARQLGANIGTLRTTIARKGWSKLKQAFIPERLPGDEASLAPWLDARARTWIVETVTLLNKVTGKAARADIPEGWKGLREIVSLLKELIPAGRALYGLDQQKDKSSQQTAILVKVDVESVGQVAPERTPQSQSAIDVEQVSGSSHETVNQMTGSEGAEIPGLLVEPGAGA